MNTTDIHTQEFDSEMGRIGKRAKGERQFYGFWHHWHSTAEGGLNRSHDSFKNKGALSTFFYLYTFNTETSWPATTIVGGQILLQCVELFVVQVWIKPDERQPSSASSGKFASLAVDASHIMNGI